MGIRSARAGADPAGRGGRRRRPGGPGTLDGAPGDAHLVSVERLAAVLLALAAAHPGHDGPDQAAPPVRATGEEVHTPAARLAASLLDRDQPGLAARLVARDAATSAEAARVLAAALDVLEDPVGARIARERADRLEREAGVPPPARPPGPEPAAP